MNWLPLKPGLLSLLLISQTEAPLSTSFSQFRYRRSLSSAASPSIAQPGTQACAILDAEVFAHAASTLTDLRLYAGTHEIPYAVTIIEPQQQDSDDAKILNPRTQRGRIVFDLEMPPRAYTAFGLDLAARDFVATATVSGRGDPTMKNPHATTPLGTFTLFDLTTQHLFHDTRIPLSESNFPFLHVELSLSPAPGSASSVASLNQASVVKSASVPPSREAQSLYTSIQPAYTMLQMGNESTATFHVPAKVPIERIVFALVAGYKGSFSRDVKIEARGINVDGTQAQDDPTSSDGFNTERTAGTILRIHESEAGHDLSTEDLSLPVAIGSNMQQPASVEVRVENGPDGSLPLSVQLQMRQRQICFDAAASGPLTLYYGDRSLDAPAYSSVTTKRAVAARFFELGPEALNPDFAFTPSSRRFVGQRPVLRWIALLGCVCIFALLVNRSTHKKRR